MALGYLPNDKLTRRDVRINRIIYRLTLWFTLGRVRPQFLRVPEPTQWSIQVGGPDVQQVTAEEKTYMIKASRCPLAFEATPDGLKSASSILDVMERVGALPPRHTAELEVFTDAQLKARVDEDVKLAAAVILNPNKP